jgi:hypothetical protein
VDDQHGDRAFDIVALFADSYVGNLLPWCFPLLVNRVTDTDKLQLGSVALRLLVMIVLLLPVEVLHLGIETLSPQCDEEIGLVRASGRQRGVQETSERYGFGKEVENLARVARIVADRFLVRIYVEPARCPQPRDIVIDGFANITNLHLVHAENAPSPL